MKKTIRQWCQINGYGGVTNECLKSAILSNDTKVVEMARRRKLNNLIKEK